MSYLENTVSAADWEGWSDEQIRLLKIAYLMGAKDAIRICESQVDGGLQGDFVENLIGSMDQRLGLVSSKA